LENKYLQIQNVIVIRIQMTFGVLILDKIIQKMSIGRIKKLSEDKP
jgi:hypothetical protein